MCVCVCVCVFIFFLMKSCDTVIPLYPWGIGSRTPPIPKFFDAQVPCTKWYSLCM